MIPELALQAITAALVVMSYAVLSRGLFIATEPARQSLVDLAGSLLDSPRVPDSEKVAIQDCLDTVHSAWAAWKLAFSALLLVFRSPFIRPDDDPCENVPQNLQSTYEMLIHRWMIATAGNSLAATLVLALAMLLAIGISLSLRAFIRALVPHDNQHGRRGAAA